MKDEKMQLPDRVVYIIESLRKHGFRADAVGGAVRDLFIGRPCDDYDITTNALPEQVESVFSSHRIIETGLKHGTVTVLVDRAAYEITTYRLDGEYLDSRHPDKVRFTDDLSEDLRRRDFTMNAICYNHIDGFFDPFGGREDIKRRLIRAVGDGERRFCEDALRILRAIRFSSVLGFDIEYNTDRALRKHAPLLKNISRERIRVELMKLLGGKYARRVLESYPDVISEAVPALQGAILPRSFDEYGSFTRLLSLFIPYSDRAERFSAMAQELRSDNSFRLTGTRALCAFDRPYATESDLRFMIKDYGYDVAREALLLHGITGESISQALSSLDAIIRDGLPCKLSQLALSGDDLISLGYRGREVGQTLESLLCAVILGNAENTRESLLSFVTK